MTTDYRLFVVGLGSYVASKVYKSWPGVIEKINFLKIVYGKLKDQKKQYTQKFLQQKITGNNKKLSANKNGLFMITRGKWNWKKTKKKLRQKLVEKGMFWK